MNKKLNEERVKEAEKNIKQNLTIVQENIEKACQKVKRKPSDISILAVTKFRSIEEIQAIINLGLNKLGENRVQEALEKFPILFQNNENIKLHLIGNLQRNKVKTILPIVDCIQSIDRISLAQEIIKELYKIQVEKNMSKNADLSHTLGLSHTIDLLMEVHTAEESKNGFQSLDDLWACMDYLLEESVKNNSSEFPQVKIQGFMTMAPFTKNEKEIRSSFQQLKKVQEEAQKRYSSISLNELSMGMTNDYEIAIEEGATMLRLGSALF